MASASLLVLAADAYINAMNSDQLLNLTYLGLLGLVIGGSYLIANRHNMGQMAQYGAIWGLIFVGVVAAYGLWGDVSRDLSGVQSTSDAGVITVPQARDGHYYLTLDINDTPVNFVVDTGASMMVLTQRDAARIGIDPTELRYLGSANTANGVVRTADVWLDTVALGPIIDTDFRATVNQGQMEGSLLGMSYLDGFSAIQFSDGQLTLRR
ncbi:TIGR02281 family clan AA aspartic protease [Yoonia sp. R2331]|uniref:retropepsin-like aspartic protease family protein n=1 Tax=Yoonia sp. R2331 TaxID=3237238 RepID=UPI0034E4706A